MSVCRTDDINTARINKLLKLIVSDADCSQRLPAAWSRVDRTELGSGRTDGMSQKAVHLHGRLALLPA